MPCTCSKMCLFTSPTGLEPSREECDACEHDTRHHSPHISHQAHGSTFYACFSGYKHIIAHISHFYNSSRQDEAHKWCKHKDKSLWKAIWALMAPEGSGFLKRNEKWQYVNVTVRSSEPSGSWLRARPTERDTCTFPSESLYFPAWDVSESLWRRTEGTRRSRTWKEFKCILARLEERSHSWRN